MDSEDVVGIIDLNNTKIACLIFKIKNNDDTEILSTSVIPSEGINNDVVVNLSKATNAVRICISDAEKKAKVSLKKINVVFEQLDFLCTKFSNHKKINGSKIYRDDIEFLLKEAKNQLILNDANHSIIHIFNHNYVVDGQIFLKEPIDEYADLLTHEITFITAPKNNLKNIKQVFFDCDLEIERLFSRTFALGASLLSEKELQIGTALINLELDRVSMGLFKNLALVNSITLPIGTNHITKDISKICSLNLDESEVIKNKIDFLFQNNQNIFDEKNYLKNFYFTNTNFRKISKNLILDVTKARLDEIFTKLKEQLILAEFNSNSETNIFLMGEGSNLINFEKYCENFFGLRVNKMKENNIEEMGHSEKKFASLLGAIKIIKDGWETEAIPKKNARNTEKIGFFEKIFKKY